MTKLTAIISAAFPHYSAADVAAEVSRAVVPQLRHYGRTFELADIPRFDDGEYCTVIEPYESKVDYVGGWEWQGQVTGRVHGPVSADIVEEMVYLNSLSWGAGESTARESGRLHAAAQTEELER
jgi:hypothetical protein